MDPRLAAAVRSRAGVFTRADALAAGYSPAEILARLRSGVWRTVRRGVYVTREDIDRADDVLGRARMAAALAVLPARAALSHRSAATLHGLPLVGVKVPVAEVTVPGAAARRRPDLVVHGRALPAQHVVETDGLRVTTAARTAVDLARHLPFPAAVAVVDAALRQGTPAEQLRDLAGAEIGPYSRKARRAVAFGDGLAESPGESLSRVAIASHGLPPPRLQAWIDHDGRRLGRVDFLWPEHWTIGEFDGRLKYDDPARLWDEKLREDSMRAIGYRFLRWTWADVYGDFTPTAVRLRASFARHPHVSHTA